MGSIEHALSCSSAQESGGNFLLEFKSNELNIVLMNLENDFGCNSIYLVIIR